jgi:hypothetical protein
MKCPKCESEITIKDLIITVRWKDGEETTFWWDEDGEDLDFNEIDEVLEVQHCRYDQIIAEKIDPKLYCSHCWKISKEELIKLLKEV